MPPPPDRCRLTAVLLDGPGVAWAAWSCRREQPGPNGEPDVAVLLHTTDGGRSWDVVPLRQALWARLRRPGFPTWPPEAVLELGWEEDRLWMVHRDEWVPFEPGGESLWRSTRSRAGTWSHRRLRTMDYEGADSPLRPPEVGLPEGLLAPPLERVFAGR